MKRVMCFVLCCLLFFSSVTGAVALTPESMFADVESTTYYAYPVQWAVDRDITKGTASTTFSPKATCTRGQVVTFLWRAAGAPKASSGNPFKDVKSNKFYYDAVLWAVKNGITDGMTANTFAPNATCTRGQVVTFLWRALGKSNVSGHNPFKDVSGKGFYYKAMLWAVGKGITTGTSATTFAPNATCTRGQIVTFLYRAYSPLVAEGKIMAYNKNTEGYIRTVGMTANLAKRGSNEYYTFGISLRNNTGGDIQVNSCYATINDSQPMHWGAYTLRAGTSSSLHIYYSNMQRYQHTGSFEVKLYVNGQCVLEQTFVLKDTAYSDRSDYWGQVFPLPSADQIAAYQNPNQCRSQYLYGWTTGIAGDIVYGEYSVDFKSDHAGQGTYCSLANWQIDCSSLLGKYAKVSHQDGGVHGYTGLQNTSEGKKFIMSIWEVYCTDHNGQVTTIRPKVVYPQNAKMGTFDNEGSGGQYFAKYNWETSHWYRLYMNCSISETTGNTVITTWLCDLETMEWTKMCAYDIGFRSSFKGWMGLFLENYDTRYAGEVRSMEIRNMRIRTTDGVWRNVDELWMSASDTIISHDFTLYLDGSYAFGARGDRFYMITSGVGGDWYHNGRGQREQYYYISHTESGKPY